MKEVQGALPEAEQKILTDILNKGKVVRDEFFETPEGLAIQQYTVIDTDGETYDLTKHNGVFVYIFHWVR